MKASLEVGSVRPLVREIPGTPDPLALYSALSEEGTLAGTFLLESGDAGAGAGERSLIGASCSLRIVCHDQIVTIEAHTANGRSMLPWIAYRLSPAATVSHLTNGLKLVFPEPRHGLRGETASERFPSPLAALRTVVLETQCDDQPVEDTFLAAGIFSYDLIDLLEDLPPGTPEEVPTPNFEFFVPDRLVIVEHRLHRTLLVAHAFGGENGDANLHDASRAVARLTAAVNSVAGTEPPRPPFRGRLLPASVTAPEAAVDLSDSDYGALVARLHCYLERGDVYQIVPSRTFSARCSDPLAAYGRLRFLDPSPYLFYIRAGAQTLFGASPETAVRVGGVPRRITVRPIAGTAARGVLPEGGLDPDLDSRREAALHLDPKETAEHMMLVDLARNDVARVSRPGTRRVTRLLEVERYAHVMHLVSEVQGELLDNLDALDAYVAAMNPGTLVGAPKLRAAQILREVENDRRGVYGGGVGFLTHRGNMDTAIAIRAAAVRDGVARVRTGAGVVLDSDPAAEALETRRKAAAVLWAVNGAENDRA